MELRYSNRFGIKKAIQKRTASIVKLSSRLLNRFYDLCWLESDERMSGAELLVGVIVLGTIAVAFIEITAILI